MHEATIAQHVLRHIERCAVEGGAAAESVKMRAGELRNVDPDTFCFAFDVMKLKNELTRDCELQLQIVDAIAECVASGHTYRASMANAFACPQCGGGIGKLVAGEELEIVEVILHDERSKEETTTCTT